MAYQRSGLKKECLARDILLEFIRSPATAVDIVASLSDDDRVDFLDLDLGSKMVLLSERIADNFLNTLSSTPSDCNVDPADNGHYISELPDAIVLDGDLGG